MFKSKRSGFFTQGSGLDGEAGPLAVSNPDKKKNHDELPDVDPELAAMVCRQVILPLFQEAIDAEQITVEEEVQQEGFLAELRLSNRLLGIVNEARDGFEFCQRIGLQELEERWRANVAETQLAKRQLEKYCGYNETQDYPLGIVGELCGLNKLRLERILWNGVGRY